MLALSDQAWPCLCDWNGDGVPDLLVGGGYGFPRIVINEGTIDRPSFAEPKLIEPEGKPIRFLRDDILGEPQLWHNMGYPYPVFVRWDDDDLPDLVCPNETNRIFWYKNIGTKSQPRFGPRQQIMVEGFDDSPERRSTSAKRAVQGRLSDGEGSAVLLAHRRRLGRLQRRRVDRSGHARRREPQGDALRPVSRADGQLRLRKSERPEAPRRRPIDAIVTGRALDREFSGRRLGWRRL